METPSVGAGEDVDVTVTIRGGETVIEMVGDRDAAVVVRSASGERIYLPPEDFKRPARQSDSPYQSARDDSSRPDREASPYQSTREASPYQSTREASPYRSASRDSPYEAAEGDSPYQSVRQRLPEEGLRPTPDGFLIRHPEPVTDLRILR